MYVLNRKGKKNSATRSPSVWLWPLWGTVLAMALLGGGVIYWLASRHSADWEPETAATAAERDWGVQVLGIRRTAANHMLDFRFRVLDPAKAAPLLDHINKPHLIHEKSGSLLHVPHTMIGSMRQTTRKVYADRNYFVFFDNPGLVVAGDEVSVVIGGFRAEHMKVQ